jgi:15-cis-phytoene synthase
MKIQINKLNDLQYCEKITRYYGKTYYFSTYFLPKKIRKDVFLLYAFLRLPDEIVDNNHLNNIDSREFLLDWKQEWRKAYTNQTSKFTILNMIASLFKEEEITDEYGTDFIQAMIVDLTKKRYENYEDLKSYMYGSAGVVGLIMTHLLKYKDSQALIHAEQLGYAMQMTNFLRDIKEDYEIRNRIYLPENLLKKYNIDENYFIEKKLDEKFINLLKEEIAFTKNLFKEANHGIKYLESGHLAIYLASVLYSKILDKIEENNYDIWNHRARLSLLEKIKITIKIIWQIKIKKEIPWQLSDQDLEA